MIKYPYQPRGETIKTPIPKELSSLIRRRLISRGIDIVIFPFLLFLPWLFLLGFLGIKEYESSGVMALIQIAIMIATYLYLFWGLLLKYTGGYSLGGLLVGIKIVHLEGKTLTTTAYLKRTLLGIWDFINPYKHSLQTRFNSLGQFEFDEHHHTTVQKRGEKQKEPSPPVRYYEQNFFKEFVWMFLTLFLLSTLINALT